MLVGVFLLLLLLDGVHVDLTEMFGLVEVLVQCVWGVNWLVGLCSIFAGVFEDDVGSAYLTVSIREQLVWGCEYVYQDARA